MGHDKNSREPQTASKEGSHHLSKVPYHHQQILMRALCDMAQIHPNYGNKRIKTKGYSPGASRSLYYMLSTKGLTA